MNNIKTVRRKLKSLRTKRDRYNEKIKLLAGIENELEAEEKAIRGKRVATHTVKVHANLTTTPLKFADLIEMDVSTYPLATSLYLKLKDHTGFKRKHMAMYSKSFPVRHGKRRAYLQDLTPEENFKGNIELSDILYVFPEQIKHRTGKDGHVRIDKSLPEDYETSLCKDWGKINFLYYSHWRVYDNRFDRWGQVHAVEKMLKDMGFIVDTVRTKTKKQLEREAQ